MSNRYKINLNIGVRPLVKGDLNDLRAEILQGEEFIVHEYRDWWDEDIYEITNINTIKSKLLKSMFPND